MKRRQPTNLAASVHARLLNQARSSHRSFNDLVQLYAMERFLYRLSKSSHAEMFILKGALLLRLWDPASYRTTRDIDLLGRVDSAINAIVSIVQDICRQIVERLPRRIAQRTSPPSSRKSSDSCGPFWKRSAAALRSNKRGDPQVNGRSDRQFHRWTISPRTSRYALDVTASRYRVIWSRCARS